MHESDKHSTSDYPYRTSTQHNGAEACVLAYGSTSRYHLVDADFDVGKYNVSLVSRSPKSPVARNDMITMCSCGSDYLLCMR